MEPFEPSANATNLSLNSRSSRVKRNGRISKPARRSSGRRLVGSGISGEIQSSPNSGPDPSILEKAQADFAAAALEFAFGGSQGELESWRELLRDPDPKIRLAAHKFLTNMRDGTPRKAEPRKSDRPLQFILGPVTSDDELPRWMGNSSGDVKVLRTDGTLTDFPKFSKE